eukprot:6756044-Prymnesium_polylepis.1
MQRIDNSAVPSGLELAVPRKTKRKRSVAMKDLETAEDPERMYAVANDRGSWRGLARQAFQLVAEANADIESSKWTNDVARGVAEDIRNERRGCDDGTGADTGSGGESDEDTMNTAWLRMRDNGNVDLDEHFCDLYDEEFAALTGDTWDEHDMVLLLDLHRACGARFGKTFRTAFYKIVRKQIARARENARS